MDSKKLIDYLKKKGLLERVKENFEALKPILTNTLGVRKRDELLIISDLGISSNMCATMLAGCYLLAAKRLGLNYKVVLQNPKFLKEEANNNIVNALNNTSDGNFIVLALSGKLGSLKQLGKSFRKFAKSRHHHFCSTLKLAELETKKFRYLMDSIDIDYVQLKEKCARLERVLTLGHTASITTKKGTNLKIGIRGMKALSNDAHPKTTKGNIPAGEVYLPPRANQVEGRVVIDGSLRTTKGTDLCNGSSVALSVKEGKVISISGDPVLSKKLNDCLSMAEKKSRFSWGVRRIAELGIGLNKNAKVIGPTIINEKALGTAHIALGSNAWFGGNIFSIIHLDQVFYNPNIWVDGRRII